MSLIQDLVLVEQHQLDMEGVLVGHLIKELQAELEGLELVEGSVEGAIILPVSLEKMKLRIMRQSQAGLLAETPQPLVVVIMEVAVSLEPQKLVQSILLAVGDLVDLQAAIPARLAIVVKTRIQED